MPQLASRRREHQGPRSFLPNRTGPSYFAQPGENDSPESMRRRGSPEAVRASICALISTIFRRSVIRQMERRTHLCETENLSLTPHLCTKEFLLFYLSFINQFGNKAYLALRSSVPNEFAWSDTLISFPADSVLSSRSRQSSR